MVVQRTVNAKVAGSNPAMPVMKWRYEWIIFQIV